MSRDSSADSQVHLADEADREREQSALSADSVDEEQDPAAFDQTFGLRNVDTEVNLRDLTSFPYLRSPDGDVVLNVSVSERCECGAPRMCAHSVFFSGLSVCLSVCLSIVALSMHRCLGFRDFFSSFSAPAQQTRLVLSGLRGSCRKSPLHTVTRRESRRQGGREGDTVRERDLGTDAHTNRDAQTDRKTRTHTYTRARAHTHTHTQVSAIKVSRKEKREILGLYPCTAPASYVLPSRVALVREAEVREVAAASSPG